jgi:hypothetical protein
MKGEKNMKHLGIKHKEYLLIQKNLDFLLKNRVPKQLPRHFAQKISM